LVDRKQDMILSGAINVYPAELEEVLYEHPNIKEAAVIGTKDDKWGEDPVAIIVPEKGKEVAEEEMRESCSERLARHNHQQYYYFRDESLPRSLQGKVLKFKLREAY